MGVNSQHQPFRSVAPGPIAANVPEPPPAAPQDGDEVLVPGPVPLTRAMAVRFTEALGWILDVSIPAEVAVVVQSSLAADWAKGDSKTIDETRQFVAFFDSISGFDLETRDARREALQPEMVAGLRAESDPAAAALIRLYDQANTPIAMGNPPLTQEMANCYFDLLALIQALQKGEEWQPLPEATKLAGTLLLALQYPSLQPAQQAWFGGLPIDWTSLRATWKNAPAEAREQIRQKILGSLGPLADGLPPGIQPASTQPAQPASTPTADAPGPDERLAQLMAAGRAEEERLKKAHPELVPEARLQNEARNAQLMSDIMQSRYEAAPGDVNPANGTLTVTHCGKVIIYDVVTGTAISTFEGADPYRARNGETIFAVHDSYSTQNTTVILAADGSQRTVVGTHAYRVAPILSPDGSLIAVNFWDQGTGTLVYRRDGASSMGAVPVAVEAPAFFRDFKPEDWTPDGRLVATCPVSDDVRPLLTHPSEPWLCISSVELDKLLPIERTLTGTQASVSPDGQRLAFVHAGEVWVAKIDGSERMQVTAGARTSQGPAWSPDGQWLAVQHYDGNDFEPLQPIFLVSSTTARQDPATKLLTAQGFRLAPNSSRPTWRQSTGIRAATDSIPAIPASPEAPVVPPEIQVPVDSDQVSLPAVVDSAEDEASNATSGRPDPAFNGQGAAVTAFAGELAEARALCVQPDGRIILAGSVGATADGPKDFALVRYNPDGMLDETFGTRGKSVVHVAGSDSSAYALAINADATKIVVVGSSLDLESNSLDFLLVRLTADGLLDTTFNGNGIVVTDFLGHGDDIAYAVALQSDGKILAAGFTTQPDSTTPAQLRTEHFAVARYLPDGSLDLDFGDDGLVVTSFPGDLSRARAICIQPTGEIIVAGIVRAGGDSLADFAAVRYGGDGRLDETFGVGGRVLIDVAGTGDTAHAVALQADGKIVLAGEAADGMDRLHFLLVRLDPRGKLDPDFNSSGVLLVEDLAGSAFGIAVQGDGKLLAGGYATHDATDDAGNLVPKDDFAIARFETGGALDMSFGKRGVALIDLGGRSDRAAAITLQTDGAILAAGSTSLPGEMYFAVIRLLGDSARE